MSAGLEEVLGAAAHRVADLGTRSEPTLLRALATAARGLCPGAAAALVDWDGTEVARLRAFGIVHGVLLERLDPHARALLTAELLGESGLALAG